jgi:hypothetical protein
MQEDDQPTSSAAEIGTAPSGKDFNPSDMDEGEAAPAESSEPTKAVPIGRPISEAEYGRRKERARDEDLPPGVPDAQQDPARRGRDG